MDFINRIAPELQKVLKDTPRFTLPDDLEPARNVEFMPPHLSMNARISNRMIPGSEEEIMVKIYEPIQRTVAALPAVLWFHGGGYVLGHPNFTCLGQLDLF